MEATRSSPILAIAIRPPVGAETRLCRMLLPEGAGVGAPSEYLLATASGRLSTPGAAAFVNFLSPNGELRLAVKIHVVRPARRRGVGTRLFQALLDIARTRQARGLVVRFDPSPSPRAPCSYPPEAFARYTGSPHSNRASVDWRR